MNINLKMRLKMLPPKSDPKWRAIVTSTEVFDFSALPTKMIMMRIRLLVQDGTPQKIDEAIDIAFDFFTKAKNLVSDDIKLLFEKPSTHKSELK